MTALVALQYVDCLVSRLNNFENWTIFGELTSKNVVSSF